MGVYPESFIAPMRADIHAIVERMAPAKSAGDAHLTAGKAVSAPHHGDAHSSQSIDHAGEAH